MINLLLCGCLGTMGKVIASTVKQISDMQIVAGIDNRTPDESDFPVYTSFDDIKENIDVVIDFSNPKLLPQLLAFISKTKTPSVIATTGFSEEQKAQILAASEIVPIFFSANMSLGVNLLRELAVIAAKVLGNSFDVEIIEKHHNKKVDAPSGTALMLADALASALPYDARYVYDRHSVTQKREKEEIGIHSIRGGTIVGEHEIIYAGEDEIVSIKHIAHSKAIFAKGAVSAARFISAQKSPAIYDMASLVKSV